MTPNVPAGHCPAHEVAECVSEYLPAAQSAQGFPALPGGHGETQHDSWASEPTGIAIKFERREVPFEQAVDLLHVSHAVSQQMVMLVVLFRPITSVFSLSVFKACPDGQVTLEHDFKPKP